AGNGASNVRNHCKCMRLAQRAKSMINTIEESTKHELKMSMVVALPFWNSLMMRTTYQIRAAEAEALWMAP
ncbi:hypothetical protein FOZ62_000977, partial [Perkinsus olseni]